MAQKKRQSRVSSGTTKAKRIEKHNKKLAKFAEKRENGTAYKYVPLKDFPEGERDTVRAGRVAKSVSSKLPIAQWTSKMRKLDNEIEKKKARVAILKRNEPKTSKAK